MLRQEFWRSVRCGLGRAPKRLEPKWFYDARGAELFVRITTLGEYYPARAEREVLQNHGEAIAAAMGEDARLVDLGSGDCAKAAMLLGMPRAPRQYMPVDISAEMLYASAEKVRTRLPTLSVLPIVADFTQPFTLPESPARTCVYFPGSTIGNLEPGAAQALLARLAMLAGNDGCVLLTVDLKKDPAVLHRAYNDGDGVTAAFNLNLLARINRELEGDFRLPAFSHYAFYDAQRGRVEMQLISLDSQTVRAAGACFDFADGEPLSTEYSYKYSLSQFAALARDAGLEREYVWLDTQGYLSLQLFTVSAR